MNAGWNPHYVAYAMSQGHTPDEQVGLDGSRMDGFIVWNGERMREWQAESGIADRAHLTDEMLAQYAAWLGRWGADHGRQLTIFDAIEEAPA